MASFDLDAFDQLDSRPPSSLNESVREEISLRLREKNLEYRTKVVEEAMAPLIGEVTSLTEYRPSDRQSSEKRKKREPQKLSKLIQLVDKATRNFIAVGEEIAHENPDFQEELLLACDDVKVHGESMQKAATYFSQNACEPGNRSEMAKASRELLLCVTRLMVVADMVDVNKLLEASDRIESKLTTLMYATSERELMERIRDCSADILYITQRASVRQNDGRSESSLQLLAAANMELNQASRMLACVSKAFLQFPGARAAKENQEYVVTRMLDSLKTIALLANGDDASFVDCIHPVPGELATCFRELEENLDETVSMVTGRPPSSQTIKTHVANLQQGIDRILTAAAELAGSQSTRDHRQHAIITQCGELKSDMNMIISAIEDNDETTHPHERERMVGDLVTDIGVKTSALWRELCRATVDHISDVYMGTLGPLISMCEAAQEGDEKLVEDRAENFREHATTLQYVALLACSLSEDSQSNRLVRMSAKNIHTLMPQVINAALTLAKKPSSHVAQKSMSVFKEAWAENVSVLTDSVDTITPLVEFMSVTESHICEDGQQFLLAAETCNTKHLERTVQLIRGRCKRLCHVVRRELKNNRSHYSKDQIRQSNGAMEKLVMKSMSQFCDLASKTGETLHMTLDAGKIDLKALEETLQKVVDNVRNVRRSILVTRAPEDLEGMESDLEDLLRPPRPMTPTPSLLSQISTGSSSTIVGGQTTPQKFQRTPKHSMVFEVEDAAKEVMSRLPPEQQEHLAKVTEELTAQQAVFEAEVNKWDDSGNDIVVLAKEMCIMMMDMSDFTRGVGPLHSTMDVIITAKDIVRAAVILDGLARSIADHCPDEQCRKDILAYLDRIRLYCHQLNITANVKADLKSSLRDTVDNASTLITISKNLMTSVVETVKTCYIASTAIARSYGGVDSDQFIQWRLTLPRKKKLYRSDSDMSATDVAAMGGNAPIIELGQFKPGRHLQREPKMTTLTEIPHEH